MRRLMKKPGHNKKKLSLSEFKPGQIYLSFPEYGFAHKNKKLESVEEKTLSQLKRSGHSE